jgi:hypothetical protein
LKVERENGLIFYNQDHAPGEINRCSLHVVRLSPRCVNAVNLCPHRYRSEIPEKDADGLRLCRAASMTWAPISPIGRADGGFEARLFLLALLLVPIMELYWYAPEGSATGDGARTAFNAAMRHP